MRQVSRGSWQACGSKSACAKHNTQGGSLLTSRAHTKAAYRRYLGASAIQCLITHNQCDPNKSGCRWQVQVTQSWDAVRRLGEVSLLYTGLSALHPGLHTLSRIFLQVSSLATDVFYDNEGFEPLVNFSKIIYKSELLIRLGWRLAKPNNTSCFLIAQPAVKSHDCKVGVSLLAPVACPGEEQLSQVYQHSQLLLVHYLLQGLAGMLEVSIQADMPPLFLGNSRQVAVVTTMAVLPEMQRQGIGTALLEAAQCWAASCDVKVLALFVYRDNYTAIRYCTCTFVDSSAVTVVSAFKRNWTPFESLATVC